jgi:hypothetical protein
MLKLFAPAKEKIFPRRPSPASYLRWNRTEASREPKKPNLFKIVPKTVTNLGTTGLGLHLLSAGELGYPFDLT